MCPLLTGICPPLPLVPRPGPGPAPPAAASLVMLFLQVACIVFYFLAYSRDVVGAFNNLLHKPYNKYKGPNILIRLQVCRQAGRQPGSGHMRQPCSACRQPGAQARTCSALWFASLSPTLAAFSDSRRRPHLLLWCCSCACACCPSYFSCCACASTPLWACAPAAASSSASWATCPCKW